MHKFGCGISSRIIINIKNSRNRVLNVYIKIGGGIDEANTKTEYICK